MSHLLDKSEYLMYVYSELNKRRDQVAQGVDIQCIGCGRTDSETVIVRAPARRIDDNEAFFNICADCTSMLMVFAQQLSLKHYEPFGHNQLVINGRKMLRQDHAHCFEHFGGQNNHLTNKQFASLVKAKQ